MKVLIYKILDWLMGKLVYWMSDDDWRKLSKEDE